MMIRRPAAGGLIAPEMKAMVKNPRAAISAFRSRMQMRLYVGNVMKKVILTSDVRRLSQTPQTWCALHAVRWATQYRCAPTMLVPRISSVIHAVEKATPLATALKLSGARRTSTSLLSALYARKPAILPCTARRILVRVSSLREVAATDAAQPCT